MKKEQKKRLDDLLKNHNRSPEEDKEMEYLQGLPGTDIEEQSVEEAKKGPEMRPVSPAHNGPAANHESKHKPVVRRKK